MFKTTKILEALAAVIGGVLVAETPASNATTAKETSDDVDNRSQREYFNDEFSDVLTEDDDIPEQQNW